MADHAVTGVLLVGGASSRFGSPKALARLDGETLAERVYGILERAFGTAIAVGKAADGFELPFPILDDGSELRAPIVGVAAGLRLAPTELCVFVPTDMPLVTPRFLRRLARAAEGGDAAVPETGPLPGAYTRSALPLLERRIDAGNLALRDALAELRVAVVPGNLSELANVNVAEDLDAISK